MVSDGDFFLIGEDGIFLLIACDHHLNTFLQICLRHIAASAPYRAQCSLIHDVGKLRTGCSGCHSGHFAKVHLIIQTDLSGVNLQDFLSSLQIRQFYRHTAVKASRTGKSRVERFRTVGRCENDDSRIALESVHLRQKLVQRLFPLIVTAYAAVTFLADRIDLINKYDTRRFFLCLLKQVADLGCSHSYKHFHKFRTGHGEERDIRFTCHCLCKHRFTCSRRAYEQNAFRHRRADLFIFSGIVQVFDDLGKIFLGFVLACHISKPDSFRGFYIDFRIAFPHTEHHGVRAACILHHFL